MFILAQEIYSGRLDGIHMGEAEMMMQRATNCGHVGAIKTIANYYSVGAYDYVQSGLNAYAWFDVAKSLGANVEEEMNDLKLKLSDWEIKTVRQDHPWLYNPKSCLTN